MTTTLPRRTRLSSVSPPTAVNSCCAEKKLPNALDFRPDDLRQAKETTGRSRKSGLRQTVDNKSSFSPALEQVHFVQGIWVLRSIGETHSCLAFQLL
jgi:hypothetical protein